MTEPDVTLSDYGLFLECLIFVSLLLRKRYSQPLRFWFALFFGSISLASLLGGTVHGFFSSPLSAGFLVLWPLTLIQIGLTAFAGWGIGARILFSKRGSRKVTIVAGLFYAFYVLLIVSSMFFPGTLDKSGFFFAVLHYLPAVVFLFMALVVLYRRAPSGPVLTGVLGMFLTFVAAAIQQARVSLHPVYFTHNTFYHLVQGIALFMIFWFARSLLSKEGIK